MLAFLSSRSRVAGVVRLATRALHRGLGTAFGMLFLVWFASGIVMTCHRFPSSGALERSSQAPELRSEAVLLSRPPALESHVEVAENLELLPIAGRAAYRFTRAGQGALFYADTGERLVELSEGEGLSLARAWVHEAVAGAERLDEPDQWTPRSEGLGQLPLLRVRFSDAVATEVYVSLRRAELVQYTTQSSRFWAWLGAIPHWFYFVELRRHGAIWRSALLTLSGVGIVVSLTGLLHGARVLRLRGRRASGERAALSPFVEPWLRWHHSLGLLFGLASFTWVFSGFLSLEPFLDQAQPYPTPSDVSLLQGGSFDLAAFSRQPARSIADCAQRRGKAVKRLEWRLVGGVPFHVCHFPNNHTLVLRADMAEPVWGMPRAGVIRATRALGLGAAVESEVTLTAGDDYYYPTLSEPAPNFPVLRTRFTNGRAAYVDLKTGAIQRLFTRQARGYRWAFNALHNLDFPFLYRQRRLWHVVIVALALGGGALAAAGLVAAVKRRWSR